MNVKPPPRRQTKHSEGWCARVGTVPLALLALVLTIRGSAQNVPSTDGPPGPRTGMLVGRVVDATTRAPVSDAIVMLTMPKYFNYPSAPKGRVMTDSEGRFFFPDLPAGEFYLQATKHGYAPGEYDQRRALGQSQRVSLQDGERRTDVTLRVWKYAVIGGTVVDEAGEPVVGVAVRALVKHVVAGRAQYGDTEVNSDRVPLSITDDRGMFRLSQLTPGTYVVVVPSTQTTVPAAYVTSDDAGVRADLFSAGVNDVTLLGHPRTQEVGDSALLTGSRVLIPPPPSATGRMSVYPTTFYPAARTAAEATAIALGAGDERTGLAIAVQPEFALRVSGHLVAPDGSVPPPMTIRLMGEPMTNLLTPPVPTGPDDVSFQTVSGMSDATGHFTLLGVPSGDYVLTQANRFLASTWREGKPAYWISQPIKVGTDDISDLEVQVRPALHLEGRVDFHGHGPNPPRAMSAGIICETPFGEPGRFAVEVTRDARGFSFSTVAAGGRYVVRPYELFGWFVQSITVDGTDITDRVLDLHSDLTSIVVTMTDQPTKLSGIVRDVRGVASPTAIVVVFPVDREQWSGYGESPRNLKSALTTSAGLYTFDSLPPGDYQVIAIEPADADDWQDPARLEAFVNDATRLTITAGETSKTLDLRLKAPR